MSTLPPAVSAGTEAIDLKLKRVIEERAYALWEADGRPDGRALEYWLRAEQAVADQPAQTIPRRKRARASRSRGVGQRLTTTG
jgi:hypothetical protein